MEANKEALLEKYANILEYALLNREAVEPLTVQEPALDVNDAYAIQLKNIQKSLLLGAEISGKKIGITSLAMQNLLGVHEPDYGHLFNSMDMTGRLVPANSMIQPRVEAEIAFVLKDELSGPGITLEDVKGAVDYVVGAIEIVDSRVRDWKIKLVDTVSDNASAALYVLGSKKLALAEISLVEETMKLYKNGQLVNEGNGTAVMGNPLQCVAWLANKMGQFGVPLKKGEVILSGALSGMAPAAQGDTFEAVFGSLGTVGARFI